MNYNKIQFAITILLFLLLFHQIFPSLAQAWTSDAEYSHGIGVFLLICYFVWRKRFELKDAITSPSPSPYGLITVMFGVLLFIIAYFGYQFFLQCIAMLIVLFGAVHAQTGWNAAKKIAFPLSLALLAIPMPDFLHTNLSFHLRIFSTKMAYIVVKGLGMNAKQIGNVLDLPTVTLIIGNPCSGLRSLMAFTVASLAIGYLFQKTIAKRAMLFIMSIALAVVMNTIRLVSEALIGEALKMKFVPEWMDQSVGFVVLVAGTLILFGVNALLRKTA